ncbi:hypothetical protein D3C73_958600 [compost metagenome]
MAHRNCNSQTVEGYRDISNALSLGSFDDCLGQRNFYSCCIYSTQVQGKCQVRLTWVSCYKCVKCQKHISIYQLKCCFTVNYAYQSGYIVDAWSCSWVSNNCTGTRTRASACSRVASRSFQISIVVSLSQNQQRCFGLGRRNIIFKICLYLIDICRCYTESIQSGNYASNSTGTNCYVKNGCLSGLVKLALRIKHCCQNCRLALTFQNRNQSLLDTGCAEDCIVQIFNCKSWNSHIHTDFLHEIFVILVVRRILNICDC